MLFWRVLGGPAKGGCSEGAAQTIAVRKAVPSGIKGTAAVLPVLPLPVLPPGHQLQRSPARRADANGRVGAGSLWEVDVDLGGECVLAGQGLVVVDVIADDDGDVLGEGP